jgi:hypothetical protein
MQERRREGYVGKREGRIYRKEGGEGHVEKKEGKDM